MENSKISEVLGAAYSSGTLKHVLDVLDKESLAGARLDEYHIRSDAEELYLSQAGEILSQLQPLSKSLEQLGSVITRAKDVHNQMKTILEGESAKTAVFAAAVRQLHQEKTILETEQVTTEAYMDRFYVSPRESQVLTEPTDNLDDEFFAALKRVQDIQRQGAVLLLAEAPVAGEFLMLQTTNLLDRAYANIKTSIEGQLREGSAANLRKHMALLAERPLLFKAVLSSQENQRKQKLSRDFAQFLSSEQANASVMPVRYLGAVLAWVHAAIVNEFENISLLLDPGAEAISDELTTQKSLEELLNTADTQRIISELVDSVISGIDGAMRQKLNSVIVAQTSPVTVNELQNVLLFYQEMLAKYNQPSVTDFISQLTAALDRQFNHSLELSTQDWESAVDIAAGVLEAYERGVFRDDGRIKQRLDEVLDKPFERATTSAAEDHVVVLNVLDAVIMRLAGSIIAQGKIDVYRRLQAEHETQQVAIEVAHLKQASSLQDYQAGAIESSKFLTAFDAFLVDATATLSARLEGLNSPAEANRIAERAIADFIDAYEFATKDLENARSAEEIRTLLL